MITYCLFSIVLVLLLKVFELIERGIGEHSQGQDIYWSRIGLNQKFHPFEDSEMHADLISVEVCE